MRAPLALVIDVVSVVVFAILGRAAHSEGLTPGGIVDTGWPFLVGLAVGWLVLVVWRRPTRPLIGAGLMVITVLVGNLVRVFVANDTTHWTFITVTVLVLSLFLIGWRLVATLVTRKRSIPSPVEPGRGFGADAG